MYGTQQTIVKIHLWHTYSWKWWFSYSYRKILFCVCDNCGTSEWVAVFPLVVFNSIFHIGKRSRIAFYLHRLQCTFKTHTHTCTYSILHFSSHCFGTVSAMAERQATICIHQQSRSMEDAMKPDGLAKFPPKKCVCVRATYKSIRSLYMCRIVMRTDV